MQSQAIPEYSDFSNGRIIFLNLLQQLGKIRSPEVCTCTQSFFIFRNLDLTLIWTFLLCFKNLKSQFIFWNQNPTRKLSTSEIIATIYCLLQRLCIYALLFSVIRKINLEIVQKKNLSSWKVPCEETSSNRACQFHFKKVAHESPQIEIALVFRYENMT